MVVQHQHRSSAGPWTSRKRSQVHGSSGTGHAKSEAEMVPDRSETDFQEQEVDGRNNIPARIEIALTSRWQSAMIWKAAIVSRRKKRMGKEKEKGRAASSEQAVSKEQGARQSHNKSEIIVVCQSKQTTMGRRGEEAEQKRGICST